jgi:acetyl-CoA carboxylase biotin carboxyl carrier protein
MTEEMLTHENGQSTLRDLYYNRADEMRGLLEQVRHNAVQLLSDLERVPRNLRVQAGDIAIEVEWGEEVDGVPTTASTSVPDRRPAAQETEDKGEVEYLTAPTVGVFYRSPEPGAEPFVSAGDTVRPGQQIGIVEAMKLMIPIEADRAGRITEILKVNGEAVEFGERLFTLAVEGE